MVKVIEYDGVDPVTESMVRMSVAIMSVLSPHGHIDNISKENLDGYIEITEAFLTDMKIARDKKISTLAE